MSGFHIVLHGDLSELARSGSVDIDLQQSEIYGHDLKSQLAAILAARNPQNAENIRQQVMSETWRRDRKTLPDDTRLSQGRYDIGGTVK